MDDNIKHPSTLILNPLSPPHLASFHRFLNCSRYHTRTCFPISYFRLPPSLVLILPHRLARSLLLFPSPLHPLTSLNVYLSLRFKGLPGRTTSTSTYTKHKYRTYDPRLFRVLRSSFNIGNPIPIIHIHISICLYPYINIVHTHLSYNYRFQHRHLYTTSTHPPTHGQPLKFGVLDVFLVYIPLLSYLPIPTDVMRSSFHDF